VAALGDNRGETSVGGTHIWSYDGQAGDLLTISVLADKPGSGVAPERWVEQALFDTLLFVIQPDGQLLDYNDDRDSTLLANGSAADTNSQLANLVLPVTGTYEIVIQSAYGGRTGGAYTLVIESSGEAATPTATVSATPDE
jgi:hypothetical protein